MVVALKMLGVDCHDRDIVLLGQAAGNGVHIIPDELRDAGGDEKYRLGMIFPDQLVKGFLHLGRTAKGHVLGVQHHGKAPSVHAPEILGIQGHMLGVVGALVGAH